LLLDDLGQQPGQTISSSLGPPYRATGSSADPDVDCDRTMREPDTDHPVRRGVRPPPWRFGCRADRRIFRPGGMHWRGRHPCGDGPGGLWLGCVLHDAVVAAACPGAAGAGAVAAEHLRGGPAVELHQVALGTAPVEPGVAEVVPEPVRVHVDAALAATAGDDLVDAAGGHRTPVADAEPQLRPACLGVPGADAEVPAGAAGGVVADLDGPGLAALAVDGDVSVPQVDVAAPRVAGVVADARKLRQAHSGRPEHGDHGSIPALLERAAAAGALQPRQVPGGEDRHGLVRDARRLQPGMRGNSWRPARRRRSGRDER